MSVVLNGINQYLQRGSLENLAAPITVSAFIKTDDISSIFPIFAHDDGISDNYLLEARGNIVGDPIAAMAHHLSSATP